MESTQKSYNIQLDWQAGQHAFTDFLQTLDPVTSPNSISVSLQGCPIEKGSITLLIQKLNQITTLKEFSFDVWNLTDLDSKAGTSLIKVISSFKNLESLTLKLSIIPGIPDILKGLGIVLPSLHNLESFNLDVRWDSTDGPNDSSLVVIGTALKELHNLKCLTYTFQDTPKTNETMKETAKSILGLNLFKLGIGIYNPADKMDKQGFHAISEAIKGSKSLTSLKFASFMNDNFTDSQGIEVCETI